MLFEDLNIHCSDYESTGQINDSFKRILYTYCCNTACRMNIRNDLFQDAVHEAWIKVIAAVPAICKSSKRQAYTIQCIRRAIIDVLRRREKPYKILKEKLSALSESSPDALRGKCIATSVEHKTSYVTEEII